MAISFHFRDHEEFQGAALHLAVAGGLMGLAVHVLGLAFPQFGPVTGPWALAGLAGAAAYAVTKPTVRIRVAELAVVAAVVLVLGALLGYAASTGREDTLGAGALAAAFGVLAGRAGRRSILTAVTAGAAILLGRFVLGNVLDVGETAHVPAWIGAGVGGAGMAFVCVLGLLPRHIDVKRNRVEETYAACRTTLSGEVRELADRGLGVWTKVDASLEPESPVRKTIEDSLIRLFDVARKWASVESDGARTPADQLVERMELIKDKIARTQDPVARGQYEQASAALGEQLRYLKEIGTARERVIARMHHYLAAMERLRFAVINHRSADASRLSTEVQPILEDLKDLGKEIDFSSEAMDEVEKQDALAARPPAQA